MRKIVILVGAFVRGGCERQAFLLARELRGTYGLDAEVWALKIDGEYASVFQAAGIPTRVLGFVAPGYQAEGVKLVPMRLAVLAREDPLFLVRWLRRLWRVVRAFRTSSVDVLLPFTTWPNVIAGLTWRIGGVRLCVWGERSAGLERIPWLEEVAARNYVWFAANSTAGMEFLAGEMKIARERIVVIPNGVEHSATRAPSESRKRLQLAPDQPLVVKVANLTIYKDHMTLLRAWKLVQGQWTGPNRPILALAGSPGDQFDTCRKLVEETKLDATVRFLGAVSDIPSLLDVCDLGVFSSRKEGMPNGVLECMAAGKAVVASDLPGVRDALGENAGNVLFAPGDSEDCARKLLCLLQDRKRRTALGAANRARIVEQFSVERMAERYLVLIQQGLGTKHVNPGSPQRVAPGGAFRRR